MNDSRFAPIAVVGRGCVLPDALTPAAFWDNVAAGRRSLTAVPAHRWRLAPASVLGPADGPPDRTWSDVGGYVRNFQDVFDPTGFAVDSQQIRDLDPSFHWVLHGAREALREAGDLAARQRTGLILGNLSFPSAGLSAYAEHVWLDLLPDPVRRLVSATDTRPDPRNRFSSGLPAHFAARALELGAGAFALDAACASSLYAIKLACDRLHDGRADLMLAGAVNCPDDLFIHLGFSALSALSRTGRSRPFHCGADGLVPAEGAAFIALMRLPDALKAGARVIGVVRGIGLSNDGRAGSVLVPSEDGQERAMRRAYEAAGIAPETVSLLECHATGTSVGDTAEVNSTARVFARSTDLPIGSAKSNLGHLITAAGAAGLLKTLGAIENAVRPATLGADEPLDALKDTPLRLLHTNEDWYVEGGPRRAAVSAFGFGGNNAHLVVEAWEDPGSKAALVPPPTPSERGTTVTPPVAVVGVAVRAGTAASTADFLRLILSPAGGRDSGVAETVDVTVDGVRFPPKDLEEALPQQLLLLETAREAVHGLNLPPERTYVLAGMGCDPEVARYGARWRVAHWLRAADRPDTEETGIEAEPEAGADERARTEAAWQDAFHSPLTAAGVVGTMPNIVANRLNVQFDLTGPGFTVSAEEASGTVSLNLAVRALRHGEADAAIVGAVDLSAEPVHRTALQELGKGREPGDAAVVLVLKRLDDARRDGDPILAVLDDDAYDDGLAPAHENTNAPAPSHGPGMTIGDRPTDRTQDTAQEHYDPTERIGSPHAAHGLLAVATAVLALRHRAVPRADRAADPALSIETAEALVHPLAGDTTRVRLHAGDTTPWPPTAHLRARVFSGTDTESVLAALATASESDTGPARLVLLAADDEEFAARAEAARRWLRDGGSQPDGVAFRPSPVTGEIAFVFSGGSMAYQGMGRELLLAFPGELERIEERSGDLRSIAGWAYHGSVPSRLTVLDQIWGASLLGQMHAEITRGRLGITPQAVLGYSSGESNALSAMGLWTDAAQLVRDARASELFTRLLAGEYDVMRTAWNARGIPGSQWASHMVGAPVERVRAALLGEPAVHMITVNAPDSCVIGGEATACERVLRRIAPEASLPVDYDIAVHVPELEAIREQWRALHRRPVTPLPGVRFYTSSTGSWYHPDTDSAADALTGMALGTVDFAGLVENAWNDGVRVFIEHGPKNLCTQWTRRILGEREHLALALDASDGQDIRRLHHVAAELMAAGIAIDIGSLPGRTVHQPAPDTANTLRTMTLPAHLPLPTPPAPPERRPAAHSADMPRAPWLPPVKATTSPTAAVEASPLPPHEEPAHTEARPAHGAPLPTLAAPTTGTPLHGEAVPPKTADGEPRSALTTYQGQIAVAHREFLRTAAEAHQRFLATRSSAQALLLATAAHLHGHTLPPGPLTASATVPADTPGPGAERAHAPLPDQTPPPSAPAPIPARSTSRNGPPPGPTFDRSQLEHLADGRISELFGPLFAPQDQYARQTRMPRPPMLLADRVTGIDAEPGSMSTGTIWTETDVRPDSWYLDATGRMPAGIMIEAGQADLLLISWLGADLLNRGERVYRLLGCELTYHGSPPTAGETLRFEIHIDGHGEHEGVRIFFFHYDCYAGDELRLSVRDGQAGFFTDEELAATRGVLWDPHDELPPPAPVAPPALPGAATAFGPDQVRAFSEGRLYDCFGTAWDATRAHIRSPRITHDDMLFLHEVTECAPDGGPWQRGYLRAETPIHPDDWFFEGHFKNDPCMPGTLMFEGCLQAMSFYLAALGHTATRDGWRFEPVPSEPYLMRCRGQVTPRSRKLVYEVFVIEVTDGPEPTLFADVLCTVDGVKAFHAGRVGLRLVPDWPLDHWRTLGPPTEQPTGLPVPLRALGGLVTHHDRNHGPVAEADGFAFDYASLLACAWGRPTNAFGPMYEDFDGVRRVARLPGPPYHFMSRVAEVHGPQGGMHTGSRVVVDYDVPDQVWYQEQNGSARMPLAVLMEVVLQPCGWLASYVGSALASPVDLLFRNLDGDGTVHREVPPGTKTLRTTAVITRIAQSAGMIIESFDVECAADGTPVFSFSTDFGYFPKEAFDHQTGLPPTAAERTQRDAPCPGFPTVDLTTRPDKYCAGSLRLAGPMLLMLDRVTGFWPDAGRAGLGRLRSQKDVDPGEWFFKAHFFQDPVQPGSLGIEAMAQLLQFYMIERGMGAGMTAPRFEPVMGDSRLTWKYRGQVVPTHTLITVEMEILETGEDERGPFAVAEAWLWADDTRIYHAARLAMRIVPGDDGPVRTGSEIVSSRTSPWLTDHQPTWTVPVLPMMSVADRLGAAGAAHTGRPVAGLRDVRLRRWLPAANPLLLAYESRLTTDAGADACEVTLLVWRDATDPALSRFEPAATGTVLLGTPRSTRPRPLEPPPDAEPVPDPYERGALFHGPAFRYLTSLSIGRDGASAVLRADAGTVPHGALHQGLLDAATHAVPHDELWRWSPDVPCGTVGYPQRLVSMDLFEPLPSHGEVRAEARFAGFGTEEGDGPMFDIQLCHQDRVVAAMRLVDVLLPQGALGEAPVPLRTAFLRDRTFADGLGLSTTVDGVTTLCAVDVERCDWLKGTVAALYGLPSGARGTDHLKEIAIRDHVARILRVHPVGLHLPADLSGAAPKGRPEAREAVIVEHEGDTVTVRSARPAAR
ncbi:beta-ketoacyl synthase N-terminal-like domain-containing protein [Streptomyces sp. NPDC056632]|uniref:beta-ketoacyl synthase N-terminal-like domain-containing protein n=1 Tax=Streptomyces sp. NPDC056632 TaxID=3345884 RepID=UPI00367B6B06